MPDTKWGDGFVKWKELVVILITMIASGASLFGYVLGITKDAAANEIIDVEERIERLDKRHDVILQRIEIKLDKIKDSVK